MGAFGKGVKWMRRNVGGTLSGGRGYKSSGGGMLKIKMRKMKMPKMKRPR